MHMADALLSPLVGVSAWVVTAAVTVCCSRQLGKHQTEQTAPMMAVLGAFVFAAQMINFAIPGTGSSGHLGGGLLLSILLGPYAAFLTLASVLTVQALFFADGGLLALGCNIFNLGFFPCFIAYPLIYRPIAGDGVSPIRRTCACLLAAVVGLGLGALAVVLESGVSGLSDLPFTSFLLLMLPIHLAIGLVEGGVTAAVVGFVAKARPDVLQVTERTARAGAGSWRGFLGGLLLAALVSGGVLSWFASEDPDGLEWSMQKASGKKELEATGNSALRQALVAVQSALAVMPDYNFKPDAPGSRSSETTADSGVRLGTSVAGLLGVGITLCLAGVIGIFLRRRYRQMSESDAFKV